MPGKIRWVIKIKNPAPVIQHIRKNYKNISLDYDLEVRRLSDPDLRCATLRSISTDLF